MLDIIVRYLHGARVPFKLSSYPSEEPRPTAVHPLPPYSMLLQTEIVSVDGRIVLACYPAGEVIDYGALGAVLGGTALSGSTRDLPGELPGAGVPVPPFGQLFGVTIVVDQSLTNCAVLVFNAFSGNDYFDIPYEDWARLEAPRVASFASAGELPAGTSSSRGASAAV